MFRKVQKNGVAMMVLAGSLVCSPLLAAGDTLRGSLVPATPYDSRIEQAGIPAVPVFTQRTQSAESLFIIAKSFRNEKDARGKDYWQTPQETEARRSGDCEDKSLWLFAKLKMNGFDGARLVVGRLHSSSTGLHVWVALTDDSGSTLYILDPANQKKIWKTSDFSEGDYRPLYSFDGSHRYRHDL